MNIFCATKDRDFAITNIVVSPGLRLMKNLEFTEKERLFLVNQYRILAAVCPNEREIYERKEEILTRGYVAHYNGIEEWLSEEVPESRTDLVSQILLLFDDLDASYKDLKDKTGIPVNLLHFSGFSANEESDLFGYLGFFLDRYFGQKYTNLREPGQDMNSHIPMLPIYNRMMAVYNEYRGSERYLNRRLTCDEIIKILKAGYPHSKELQAL